MKQAEILLPTAVDHGFDYRAETVKPGGLVSVPFGRGQSLGVVWGEGKADLPPAKIKSVAQEFGEFPPLSDAMRAFIDWAAWYNCAPKGAVLKMVLPIGDVAKEGRRTRPHPPTPRGFGGHGPDPLPRSVGEGEFSLAPLSGAQKKAAAALEEKIGKGFSVTLLDGVTGSGKTEVYFDAIARALVMELWGDGVMEKETTPSPHHSITPSQTLVLLPEIALSVQWLERFEKRFGFKPLVWNSEISPAKKRETWKAISRGEARVVVGARSALFLPYRNLSLIVIDEEHDQSYKQEDGVIYHARDMAVARARFEKIPAVLVSATPSLESYYNARQGKYAEVSLPDRHNGATLPAIDMVDMRQEKLDGGHFISGVLREQLARAVTSGHQSLLFLNRRGYAPLMVCSHCGHRFECPSCSAWMVLHKGKRVMELRGDGVMEKKNILSNPITPSPHHPITPYLHCHHCNHKQSIPHACPACAAEDALHACGPGVERLLDEVRDLLPSARVAVMASDVMENYKQLQDVIAAMEKGEIDILIGTQMIAKGHHFANLALVGVVDADLGLEGGDLRAAEKTYQLLHQLSGRAGREQVKGKVFLQSYQPDHPVMQALLSGDREKFLQAELAARKNAKMPPFSRLAAVIIEGAKEELVIKTAKQLAATFSLTPSPHHPLTLLGPAPAPIYRLRNKYRYRLLIKADRALNLPDFMRGWVEGVKPPSSVRVKIDVDPVGFL